MKRRDLLKLALAGSLRGVAAPSRWLLRPGQAGITELPATYIIDYAYDHLDNPAFVQKVAASPPNMLHLGHDVPFTGHWGPRSVPLPVKDEERMRLLSPAATRARFESLERMLRELHRAGVEIIFPYVDNQQMGGDIEKRLGFWEFYDHWEEYRDFGLPPRPPADPTEWLQRDPDGHIHFNNPAAYPSYAPQFFHAPCPNNEYWRLYLKFAVGKIAACGYDGLFVDDNILHCYCKYCRAGFRRYLRSRYSPAELRRNFGAADITRLEMRWQADKPYWAKKQPEFREYLLSRYKPGELEARFKIPDLNSVLNIDRIGYGFLNGRAQEFLAYLQGKYTAQERKRRFGVEDFNQLGIERPQDRLLWFETQRFWAWSIAENVLFLRAAALEINKDFVMFPNWGSMQNVGAVDGRRLHGKNVAEWKRSCHYLMFEEDYREGMPGRGGPGSYREHLAQYKFALANGVRPVVLFAGPESRWNTELAHAEAASGGGGAFVGRYSFPEVRRQYREFFARRPELFVGFESLAPVAVAFFFNQAHMENIGHLRHLYTIHPALAREHVLYDFLTEETMDRAHLERYEALILPQVAYLADKHVRALQEWVSGGGVLILTGECGTHYENGAPRRSPPFTKNVSQPDAVLPLISRLTAQPIRWTERMDLTGVRANVYRARTRIVIHLLNYELDAKESPAPVRDLPVSILLPRPQRKASVTAIRMYSPDQEGAVELEGAVRDGCLKLRVPELRVYQLIEAIVA